MRQFRKRQTLTVMGVVATAWWTAPASAQCDNWQDVGGGTNEVIVAMTMYQGKLIAGGDFTLAGGQSANLIAQWDGTKWEPLGSGVNGEIYALTVFNGELVAGGFFNIAGGKVVNGIAAWNGEAWHGFGSGMTDYVGGLAVYDGHLYAAGGFEDLLRWSGSKWESITPGTNGIGAMTVYDGKLICGGFGTISAWDGTTWQPVGPQPHGSVTALTVYDGKLVAGGRFQTFGFGAVMANDIAAWDGSKWKPFGIGIDGPSGGNVYGLREFHGDLIAGGFFTTAGGNPANNIARWNGWYWEPMGSGMNFVRPMIVYQNQLIAGGDFDDAGGVPANNIAAWTDCKGPPTVPCPGDITGSAAVNVFDLQTVITECGETGANWADTDDNGIVNIDDLLAVINGWGPCP